MYLFYFNVGSYTNSFLQPCRSWQLKKNTGTGSQMMTISGANAVRWDLFVNIYFFPLSVSGTTLGNFLEMFTIIWFVCIIFLIKDLLHLSRLFHTFETFPKPLNIICQDDEIDLCKQILGSLRWWTEDKQRKITQGKGNNPNKNSFFEDFCFVL